MSKNNTKSKEEKKNVIKKAKSPLKKKGQRGKAKPIIEVKKISKETKKAIAKKLAEELPEEKEVEFAFK
jgi:hypothetical protein